MTRISFGSWLMIVGLIGCGIGAIAMIVSLA